MRFFTILHQACNDLTAITQLRFGPPPGGAVKAPKGRCAGGAPDDKQQGSVIRVEVIGNIAHAYVVVVNRAFDAATDSSRRPFAHVRQ